MTYKNYLLSKGFSNATAESYYRSLLQYITWADTRQTQPEQSTYNELLGYIQHLKNKQAKNRTIQLQINALKHYFNWLVKRGLRTDNPTLNIRIKGIKRQKLYAILPGEELDKIYHHYIQELHTPIEKRNAVILGLLIYQGITSGELQKLKVNDIKLREGKIVIPGGRKSNTRILKLESHQVLDVMQYSIQLRPEFLQGRNTDQFILSSGSSLLLHNTLQKLIQQLHKQHPKIESLKQIRASVITHWLKMYNLRQVQYMAGHRYVSSTEAYLINDLEDLKEDINTYHPLL